jgi:hypothetical protein
MGDSAESSRNGTTEDFQQSKFQTLPRQFQDHQNSKCLSSESCVSAKMNIELSTTVANDDFGFQNQENLEISSLAR